MRIGYMAVMISLAAPLPGSVLADPDSSAPASQPAATAQAAPADSTTNAQAMPAQSSTNSQGASGQPAERVVVRGTTTSDNTGANLDQIVCRSEPPATGTRLGASRECHTVRQWNDRQRQDQRMLQQQQSVGMGGSN
jgi:hypothetical protein